MTSPNTATAQIPQEGEGAKQRNAATTNNADPDTSIKNIPDRITIVDGALTFAGAVRSALQLESEVTPRVKGITAGASAAGR